MVRESVPHKTRDASPPPKPRPFAPSTAENDYLVTKLNQLTKERQKSDAYIACQKSVLANLGANIMAGAGLPPTPMHNSDRGSASFSDFSSLIPASMLDVSLATGPE
eukprot:TRINITY_DN58014_c0_g1_i1.p1 TRINITY_DN58014_c0_g1~~TRINITY_DN58014_c0_g1_i1.p1  ORF type:complete len:107 (+),score=11.78 TRINITY_DN58014_c0_g1_i1:191-511(+)